MKTGWINDVLYSSAFMKKNILSSFFICASLAVELCLLTDYCLMFSAIYVPMRAFLLICTGVLIASVLIVLLNRKAAKRLLIALTIIVCVTCAFLQLFYSVSQNESFIKNNMMYHETDPKKEELFSEKKVLLLVPHQDDDLNVFCGVLDEYLHYGSELIVAFMTNGDYNSQGEVRIREALALYDYLGVPEDHVIFLGYGDRLCTEEYHIYNAPPDEEILSRAGKLETYAIESHPPFRTAHTYTENYLYNDMKELILSTRPDVIFCVDYDLHVDHRACSMMFEKVMGDILRSEFDYFPEVYKGFAYSTSWGAEHDFFTLNIQATHDIYNNSMIIQTPPLYRWQERIRFPVRAGTLARSLQSSAQYRELLFYQSQGEEKHGPAIINGDRVFWKRLTDSLCKKASLTASSGDPLCLNNFMLFDSCAVLDQNHDPFDGVWSPEENDQEKAVTVRLNDPYTIREVVLYDNPDAYSNILNAEIQFSNGTVMETGPLDAFGAPSRFTIYIDESVSSFCVKLISTEGDHPGLTEIEAFCERQDSKPSFIKIMDIDGNFAYDYIIDNGGSQLFLLYSDGYIPELNSEDYEVLYDDVPGCRAEIQDGFLSVDCSRGQSCTVSIRLKESGLTDSFYVQNPTIMKRFSIMLSQKLELIKMEDHELLHFQNTGC